jgi:hypothetical protein|tara:strand:- start:196 stop:417 length:222 start_codon:yes stop_codon:yes gene_type:complete
MKSIVLPMLCLPLTACPIAMAYDTPSEPKCVIDQCDDRTCSVETPEGWVDVQKRSDFKEGKKITCPLWLIDPT